MGEGVTRGWGDAGTRGWGETRDVGRLLVPPFSVSPCLPLPRSPTLP
jgi:hypothetical protein